MPNPAPVEPALAARIAQLSDQPWPELKAEWKRLFGTDAPGHSRRFVEKRIAYRWQELAFRRVDSGLLDRNERRITALIATGSLARFGPSQVPMAGTVLTRHYDGQEHRVTVLSPQAFEYRGQRFASLSAVARTITGARWNGPAFFGLRSRAKA